MANQVNHSWARPCAALFAVALACGLAACDRQEASGERTAVQPARGDSTGPGGSTGPVGVPPSSGSPAQPGVTGSGSAPGTGERGAVTPGATTGGLQSAVPAASAASGAASR